MAQTGLTIANIFGTVPAQERAFVARQLAVMLDAGLPLTQATRSLSEQSQNKAVKNALTQVVSDLENGYKFSDAIQKQPKVFNHVFVSVVAAGESSGKLDVALGLLADELERDYGFRSRVLGALLYPAFIILAMIVVGIIMVTKIVPALEVVFKQANVQLPWTTRTVIVITNSIINYWYLYILAIIIIVYVLGRFVRSEEGQRFVNTWLIKIPVFGSMFVSLEMARMTRILGIMISAGVPIITALDSVALVLDSVIYRDALLVVSRNVERGAPISQTLSKYPEFPNTVTEMVAAGEKTGKLEQVLSKLADFYEAQTNQQIKNISALVEPIVFVIVGLGVAFLIFSIIVPIYNLSSVIQ